MEFGREVFGVPGNVTQAVELRAKYANQSWAPSWWSIRRRNRRVAYARCEAALVKAERPEAEQRNLLAFAALGASEKKLYNYW